MTASEQGVLKDVLAALAAFRRIFGCELRPGTLAEVYAAARLGLKLLHGNNPGFDAVAANGDGYQIKYRATTSVVDTNSFDFDHLMLVRMTPEYEVAAMY